MDFIYFLLAWGLIGLVVGFIAIGASNKLSQLR